jgi:F-type H+-transporting ATPase subunit b
MLFDWWTFALQTINFVILVWLLHRFLYKPVLAAVAARQAEIDGARAAADKVKQEADARLADVERRLAAVAAEREAALKAASAEAEASAAARRARAEKEAATVVEDARKGLAGERREAEGQLREAALDFGVGVARRLLDEIPAEYRAEAWLERLSQYLAGLGADERARILAGMGDGAALRVVTAAPLAPAMAETWRARLQGELGETLAVAFEVDPALIAGAELHFADAVIRLSWRSQLAAMRAEIESHEYAR